VIGYYDATLGDLKLARCETVTCADLAGCPGDIDCDMVLDGMDNCAGTSNAGQGNFDNDGPPPGPGGEGIGNGATLAGNDNSVPNADGEGDACDADDDNDGLPDESDADPRSDVTYDDNANGVPGSGCLGGTDAADDGPSWDANCDGIRDGVTCSGSTAIDADGDGLPQRAEQCKWGTSDSAQDSDGQGAGDCQEAYDTNGDGAVLFPTDGLNAVKASLLPAGTGAGQFGKDGAFDFNGDDALLFPTDGLNGVKAALLPAFCTP
jgi:hypothetical protein